MKTDMKEHPVGWTTLEEGQELVKIGLNPKTADMCYDPAYVENYPTVMCTEDSCGDIEHLKPCWSLGALMSLLPPSIQTGQGFQNQYELDIRKYWGPEEDLYQIAYGNNRGISGSWHDMINTGECSTTIESVIQMLKWLLKEGYLKIKS